MSRADTTVAPFVERWGLEPDGQSFATPSSALLPVIARGRKAILKVATDQEEELGNGLMVWWDGRGSARVFEHDGPAIVIERAEGNRSLAAMAAGSDTGDDEATRVLCTVASTLHSVGADAVGTDAVGTDAVGTDAVGGDRPDGLVGLDRWFRELFEHAETRGGFFARAASVAGTLIGEQREPVVLHGDVHHGNVLDFGDDGWRAIDPKHVTGDRAFDFANILCNPDAGVALAPGRLERRLAIICAQTGIGRERMTAWTVAWCGLSAAWNERSDGDAGHALQVGLVAERMLGQA